MKRIVAALMLAALLAGPAGAQERKPGDYPLTADSLVRPGVAQGKLEGPFEFRAAAYPGTVRRYWVYVPPRPGSGRGAPTVADCNRRRASFGN
jgi:enterochelin esterase family protein